MKVAELLAEEIAREPEQVAARERGQEPPREVSAKEERRPRGKGREQDRRHVEGGDRAGGERDRREQKCEPGHRRRPDEVAPVRRPEHMRHERVVPVEHGVRPPAERPDEELRVAARSDQIAPEVREHRDREVRERDGEVGDSGHERVPSRLPVPVTRTDPKIQG